LGTRICAFKGLVRSICRQFIKEQKQGILSALKLTKTGSFCPDPKSRKRMFILYLFFVGISKKTDKKLVLQAF